MLVLVLIDRGWSMNSGPCFFTITTQKELAIYKK